MVKNRGIEISIISQFDIRRLPEFPYLPPPLQSPTQRGPSPDLDADPTNTTSRYVPIYPGSQIWFEYIIEPPHPPSATYFFKLLVNGRPVTAWDCTKKHGYYGKMIYVLEQAGEFVSEQQQQQQQHGGSYPRKSFQRMGLRFCNREDGGDGDGDDDGCIEIRVHRVEHRQRIRIESSELLARLDRQFGNQLQLINGGILEPGRPQRRYKYQLLDPVDRPFAVFRFHYRTYEYLCRNNIITATPVSPRSIATSISSVAGTGRSRAPDAENQNPGTETSVQERKEKKASADSTVGPSSPATPQPRSRFSIQSSPSSSSSSSPSRLRSRRSNSITAKTGPRNSNRRNSYIPPSDSDESLSVVAKDSIEDLSTNVPRSPNSPRHKQKTSPTSNTDPVTSSHNSTPTAATVGAAASTSPQRKLKTRLTLSLNKTVSATAAAAAATSNQELRPLSPFTSSGLLRRIVQPEAAGASGREELGEWAPRTDETEEAEDSSMSSLSQQERGEVLRRGSRRSLGRFWGRRNAWAC